MIEDKSNKANIDDVQNTSDEAARLLSELEAESNGSISLDPEFNSKKTNLEIHNSPDKNTHNSRQSFSGSGTALIENKTGLIVGTVIFFGLIVLILIAGSINPHTPNTSRTDDSRLSTNTSNSANIPYGKAKYKSGRTGKTEIIGVKLSKRTNSNGHIAYDALWADGYKSSYIFWRSGRAEIFSKNGAGNIERTNGRFRRTANGNCVITAVTNAVTTFPRFSPSVN